MKYFVFGSNGMMGKYFCSVAKNVVSITRKDYDVMENDISFLSDLLVRKGMEPGDIIMNCAGAVKQREFPLSQYVTINSLFPHQLEFVAEKMGGKLIHLTTDCVYDGLSGNYDENDNHTCTDWYGKSKSLGEPENSCCIRTSIIGLGSANNVSLLDWFLNETSQVPLKGYMNHFWNGTTCLELSRYIINMGSDLWSGTRHVHSNPTSKFDLHKNFNRVFELNKELIPVMDKNRCDRTLSSLYNEPVSNTIEKQLEELKIHHENSIC